MTRHRLGFVDKNLDNFHAQVFLEQVRGPLADRGVTIVGATAMEPEPSRAWARDKDLPYFDDVTALARQVDAFMILAPSNPEVHLALARQVIPLGKPTYVDKPFASNLDEARAIFDLADQHGVAVQSTSVLRYTNVQAWLAGQGAPAEHAITWAPGRSFEEYGIHALELAISCLGPGVKRVMRRGSDHRVQLLLDFTNGRSAVVHCFVGHKMPYAASVSTAACTSHLAVDTTPMWTDAAAAIFEFLRTGKPGIDRNQTLTVMAVRDAALRPEACDRWIDVPVFGA
jgi:hypothetical protein